ncbi:MAG: cupin domain-containing protein [Gammaproteobacteria bacterium]|nr:cupin domain-containing protein [Gammaproteobacteria bacterium]
MSKLQHTRYQELPAYITKDQSEIRELMHPLHHRVENQSLAEAIVPIGKKTLLHRHTRTEELYFISKGQGEMTLGDEVFIVQEGDTVCIRPGTPHCIKNVGATALHILCCCSPAYSHEDTELLEE